MGRYRMAKNKPNPKPPPARIDPTKATFAQAAELLSNEGKVEITPTMIERDVKAGAPANASGLTISIPEYCAWLLKQGD